MLKTNLQIGLSLYIHLPWCVRKCPYCDFNSHRAPDQLPEEDYIDALCRDLALEAKQYHHNQPITAIFLGGGTPSLFSTEALARLLQAVSDQFAVLDDVEITLEANPGTIEHGQFSAYRQVGINRISLGVQSFNDDCLGRLGRIHRGQEVVNAIDNIQQAGFDNYNLDIMHGLPNQSVDQALQDLTLAMSFLPTHISWYQLTIEPNTQYALKPPQLPDESLLSEIETNGKQLLDQQNYQQYEISAYSLLGQHQCRHNLNYWQFGDYIAVGAGAHGKLTDLSVGQIRRYWKQRHPKAYMQADNPIGGERILSSQELPLEFMLNACRLSSGFDLSLFEQTTGLDRNVILPSLVQAKQQNLIEMTNSWVQPTTLGQRFLNTLLVLF